MRRCKHQWAQWSQGIYYGGFLFGWEQFKRCEKCGKSKRRVF